jgi:hypothetical protein
MPKFKTGGRLTKAVGVGLLVGLLYGYIVLLLKWPIWVCAITAILVAQGIWDGKRRKAHLSLLASSRAGEDIGTFARSFDIRHRDTWVVRAVYEGVQRSLRGDYLAFPVLSSDRFIEDLRMHPDDLDMDLVSEVMQRTGRSWKDPKLNPYYGKVHTVADAVEFFCAQDTLAG